MSVLIDRGRHALRNRAIGLYVAAGIVVAITAAITGREFYKQGPMVLVGILVIPAVVYHLWYRRLDWDRHPVLVALRDAPERIVSAVIEPAHGREALLNESQVTISTDQRWLMLTLAKTDLDLFGKLLREHCPRIELPGFKPA
ncbi:MAG: hypothetical protein ABI867_31355 [Kofleriaceae bacterium]